jgi:hypothetical protein
MTNLRLDHIPLLEGAGNYSQWKTQVQYTLMGEGLWNQVAAGTDPLDVLHFSAVALVITTSSSPDDQAKARAFHMDDSQVSRIIRRHLGPLIETNIPSNCEFSAWNTWEHLKKSYNRVDMAAQYALRDHIASLRLRDASDVPRYLSEFQSARMRFVEMGVSYLDAEGIHQLLHGIPDTGSWGVFKQITLAAIQRNSTSLMSTPSTFESVAQLITLRSKGGRQGTFPWIRVCQYGFRERSHEELSSAM